MSITTPIKSVLFVILVVLVSGVGHPNFSTQVAMADDPLPKGHYRLTDVEVSAIERTKTADGKVSYDKSEILTHSLRFDVKTIANRIDGTQDKRFEVLNPTVSASMTVDKPIKFKGKHVPTGTNLVNYEEFNGRNFTIRMRKLTPLAIQSIRLSNDFVFPPGTYNILFEWTTTDGDKISKKVKVAININNAGSDVGKKKSADKEPLLKHSFLACGQRTLVINANGKPIWRYPHKSRDGYVLDDGTIILTLGKSKTHKGGAVIKISPDGNEKLIWEGTQAEVNGAQPTKDGTLVITEAGPKPRLLEITEEGEIKLEFPLACQTKNVHLQTRMARKLADGTFLVPHLLDFAVFNYDAQGKVLSKLDTSVPGDTARKIHTWPFTAIRHGDGQTLVTCTNGNRVVDFDANGKVIWTLTNEDLPKPWLKDPCGAQVLPNGNVVIASYAAGRSDPDAPKLLEVTRDKKVVWEYSNGQKIGVHHFQILDTDGKKLKGPAMK